MDLAKTNRKLQITAGILEIIAGTFWLLGVLLVNSVAYVFGSAVNLLELLLPISIILGGTGLCAGHYIFSNRKIEKSVLVVDGLLDLGLIGAQFWIQYNSKSQETFAVGLGVLPMILLLVAAFLVFFSIEGRSSILISAKEAAEMQNQRHDSNGLVSKKSELNIGANIVSSPKIEKPDWHQDLNKKVEAYHDTKKDVYISVDDSDRQSIPNIKTATNTNAQSFNQKKEFISALSALDALRATGILSEEEYKTEKK